MTNAEIAAKRKVMLYVRQMIKTALRKDGHKLSSYTPDDITKLAKELLKEIAES